MEVADVAKVVEIEKKLFPQPWSRQSFLDLKKDPHFWLWVAKANWEVVGYLVAQVIQEEAEIHNIAVDPAKQRQKVGSFLLKEFLNKAQSSGVQIVFLMVRASNIPARNFYESLGFSLQNRRKNYYSAPDKEDALILTKALTKSLTSKGGLDRGGGDKQNAVTRKNK